MNPCVVDGHNESGFTDDCVVQRFLLVISQDNLTRLVVKIFDEFSRASSMLST